jgi:hypothetical protein
VCWQLFHQDVLADPMDTIFIISSWLHCKLFGTYESGLRRAKKVTGRCFSSYICSYEVCVIVFIYDRSLLIYH